MDVSLQDPIAVCGVSPGEVRPLVEDATWIGGDSYDPEGGTITQYTWSLVSKPTSSGIHAGERRRTAPASSPTSPAST